MELDFENDSEVQIYFPRYESIKNFTQDAFEAILAASKAANDLPACGNEFNYYESFSGFCSVMEKEQSNILAGMSTLIRSQGINNRFENCKIQEAFDLLRDANQAIFDNFNQALDEATGKNASENPIPEEVVVSSTRTNLPINTSWNRGTNNLADKAKTYKLLSASNITRPQLKFKEKVDNSNTVFVPLIKDKPNSIKPLSILLERAEGKEEFCHPYEWEIEKFQPKNEFLEASEPMVPKLLNETPLMYVENKESLMNMYEELRNEKEIAIDLEHHSYRSFQGFVCLMQISTHEKDYIIDTLKLRLELQVLNEIFTDPKILKVLHGADMDVLWLQRDFGIYIVNMFDTGQAARVLNFPHFSLAYLLKYYCKRDPDKQFQLADWRIRPLLTEMIKYAREDTHYLLYIYDCLKNDLLQKGNELKNLLLSVYNRSKHVCLKKYEKPLFQDDSYLNLYKKSKKLFNSRQLFALKEIYSWRDKTARTEDESLGFVLPDHMLLQMAEILPREQQGILACCNPIPLLVRAQLTNLHSIILKARESAIPEFLESEQQLRIPEVNIDIDLENILHCPHDIHHIEGFSEKMEIDSLEKGFDSGLSLKRTPYLQICSESYDVQEQNSAGILAKNSPQSINAAFKSYLSPYERYNLVRKLRPTQKLGGVENGPILSSSRTEKIHHHLKQLAAVADPEEEEINQVKVQENFPSVSSHSPNEREIAKEKILMPLRIKEKKKRRQKSHLTPDIPLLVDSVVCVELSPPKKSRAQETPDSTHGDFNPFDYDEARRKLLEDADRNRKAGKNVFRPEGDLQDYRTPEKSWGKKKKHSKQASFNQNRHRGGSSGGPKSWPKR